MFKLDIPLFLIIEHWLIISSASSNKNSTSSESNGMYCIIGLIHNLLVHVILPSFDCVSLISISESQHPDSKVSSPLMIIPYSFVDLLNPILYFIFLHCFIIGMTLLIKSLTTCNVASETNLLLPNST